MQTLIASLIVTISSCFILVLDYIAVSPRSLLKALAVPMGSLIILFYIYSKISNKPRLETFEKFSILFWATISVQMTVVATGGLQSPFLILIHLFMIGISFIYDFLLATIFLLISFAVLIIDISLHQNLFEFVLNDPS